VNHRAWLNTHEVYDGEALSRVVRGPSHTHNTAQQRT
jgi:hypothetical protein